MKGGENIADLGTKVLSKDRFEMYKRMANIIRMPHVNAVKKNKVLSIAGIDSNRASAKEPIEGLLQVTQGVH